MIKAFLLVGVIVLLLIASFSFRFFINKHPDYQVKIADQTLTLPTPPLVPDYDHIAMIVMENETHTSIIGNSNAPFINFLAKQNVSADNYMALTNPSLPNYLALIGGDTFGVTTDCSNCYQSAENLVDRLEGKHLSWKAYMESMPTSCYTQIDYPYAVKHNPFIYFDDIRTNSIRCLNVVPYDQLSKDLQSADTTPNFIWITPNMCHDMHDCSIKQGDNWLSREVPKLLNSPAFKTQKSLLILTWDEGNTANNRIPTILAGSDVKTATTSAVLYNHYSLLKTIETAWNLAPLTDNDQNALVMSDFFTQN